MSHRHRLLAAGVGVVCIASLTECGVDSGSKKDSDNSKKVVVMTHDSWAAPKELIDKFQKDTGYQLEFQTDGDAGVVTNKLVLSKNAPTADVVYGVDNTFGSRAVSEGVLSKYTSPKENDAAKKMELPGSDHELTPIDYGDVCLNVDNTWFASKGLPAPTSIDDLVKPEYKDLFVMPSAATSSPGLAFFLATVAKFGDNGWQDFWTKLKANGLKVVAGWTDAYTVDFSAGEGKGSRPIVVSYSSSPPFTIPKDGGDPTTSAVLSSCFRQVEYAGVVKGTHNEKGAQAFIDFLSSEDFQKSIPDNMYMYPASGAALPDVWAKYAPLAQQPFTVDPAKINDNRDKWVKQWSDLTTG